jgi:hypothetical protein
MRRTPLLLAGLALTALLAACGPNDPTIPISGGSGGAAGASCLEGATDCDDGSFGHEATEDDARALLGVRQDELPDDVRIARVDDETFPLTEDYVYGRMTAEIEDGVVVSVVLEAEDGPITVTN